MKIAFTDFVQPDLKLEESLLSDTGLEMVVADPQCANEQDIIDFVSRHDCEAVVSLYAPMTNRVFEELPGLRIISVPLVGVDAIDTVAAEKHGVWIAHIPDAWVSEVGVHAAAMALSLIRHLPFYDRSIRENRWDYEEPGPLHRPTQMTFGLLGCGRIGRQAAASARPSFGKILGFDPYVSNEAWPDWIERTDTIEDLFAESDVISLHMPLTSETHHIVSTDLLNRMKRGSYVVNASRGALIDSDALLAALNSGQIGGAGLDVFEEEPPAPDHPLLHHPRTLVSPHAAYYSLEADEEGRSRAVKNVINFFKNGKPDHHVVAGTR